MPLKFFSTPFADSGDKVAVPNGAQVDGSVSFTTGYGYDYERNPDPLVDPLTKAIERTKMNQLFYDITSNIQQLQIYSAPEWSTTQAGGAGYKKGVRVTYSSVVYESIADSNTTTPGASATWIQPVEVDATLIAMAGTTPTANQIIYFTATDTAATTACTSFGRSMIGAADAAAGITVLGIGSPTTSTAGILRRATDVEVNAGTNVAAAVTPNQLRLSFSASIGANGYVLLPSWLGGWGVQWGKATAAKNTGTMVTLNFPTSCFMFLVGFAEDVGRGDVSIGGVADSNTQGTIYYHQDGGGGDYRYAWYFAIGN